MLRERVFAIGAGVLIALGMALIVGLLIVGAPLYPGFLGGGVSIALGAFLYHVAREARRFRREYVRAAEEGRPFPPGGPPR